MQLLNVAQYTLCLINNSLKHDVKNLDLALLVYPITPPKK